MTTNNIYHNGLEIIHICKPKLKNSYISVSKDGIFLKTPRVSKSYVDALLIKKEGWIRKKRSEIQKRVYVDKKLLDEKEAKRYLVAKIEHFSKKMGLEYNQIKFRKMKRRWGSCSSNGVITLNTYLYNTPDEQIEYVVVHELAHLVHMNHSKDFHKLVQMHLPHLDLKSTMKSFYLL